MFAPDSSRTGRRGTRRLREAGEIRTLTLLETRELGDDRIYVYDVAFAQRTLRLRLAVAPDGKIAAFSLNLRPPGGQTNEQPRVA